MCERLGLTFSSLVLSSMNRPNQNSHRLRGLYAITKAPNHLQIAHAALRGGARIIQLRDHQTPLSELLPLAHVLRGLTRDFEALFVICDHLPLARAVEADGLHLEWAPFGIEAARRELGESVLLSTGVSSLSAALEAQRAGADYLGVGPIYQTKSKPDASAPIGLDGLRAIREAVSLPIAAIGGLNERNIAGIETPMACVLGALGSVNDEAQIENAARDLNGAFTLFGLSGRGNT